MSQETQGGLLTFLVDNMSQGDDYAETMGALTSNETGPENQGEKEFKKVNQMPALSPLEPTEFWSNSSPIPPRSTSKAIWTVPETPTDSEIHSEKEKSSASQ